MASPLDLVKKQVASAFKGKLSVGTLRREGVQSIDRAGDAYPGTPTTWNFDGIRDNFNLAFAQAAGIEVTDVRILIIAGSLATTPKADDKVYIGPNGDEKWYQLRQLVTVDPAGASYTFAGFEIEAPE